MKIIGIVGKMQSGKDTFFDYAAHSLPEARRVAFADELKSEVATATGYDVAAINELKSIFRPVLQWWGTDFRRQLCSPNYWLDRLRYRVALLPEDSIVFVTDVRFHNEADLIRDMGGIIIRTVRVYTLKQRLKQWLNFSSVKRHASEVEQDKIKADYEIKASSVSELHRCAGLLLRDLQPWLSNNPSLKRRVYIAGPMRKIKNFNFPAFYAAADRLRADGFDEIFNPAEWDERMYGKGFAKSETGDLKDIPQFELRKSLSADLNFILNSATHIALLPGWETSTGAQLELAAAKAVGCTILYL